MWKKVETGIIVLIHTFPLCLYTVCAMIIWLLLKSTTLLHPALCLHLTYEDFPTALKIPDVVSVLQLTCLEIFP